MNKIGLRRWLTLGWPVVLVGFFMAALGMAMHITPSSADPQDPTLPPPFVGRPATATLDIPLADMLDTVAAVETTIFNFEGGVPAGWNSYDLSNPASGYKWGAETYTNGLVYTGTTSMWAVGAGVNGDTLNPISDTYPAGVNTWLIYGPLNLSEVTAASISFEYLLDVAHPVTDTFGLFVSTNGSTYSGIISGVSTDSWLNQSFTLSPYVGENQVWIGFNFNSAGAGTIEKGAFLDNIVLHITPFDKSYLPMVRKDPTPTPTPSPTPVPNYQDVFNNANSGWNVIRRRNTDDAPNNVIQYITFQTPTFLEAEVRNTNDYMILSPLVKARANAPYVLEADAKFDNFTDNVNDRNEFSLIFGGDYDGVPANCPNGSFTGCFNNYYAWRIQWRNGNQLYYTLMRVTGHGAGNQPVETAVWGETTIPKSTAAGDRIHRYTLELVSNTQVKLYINDQLLNTITLPTAVDSTNNYFGLGMATKVPGNGRVRFYGMAMGDGLTTTPPTGGGTTEYRYNFDAQSDIDAWKSDAQGHSRTLFASTDNRLLSESGTTARASVNVANQFVIYSPLQKVSNSDYWVESRLEFVDETDQDALGLVFAANRNEAQTCPDAGALFQTCFTNYYLVRLVYLTGDRINVRLEKVTRPSGSANPTYTLLGETTLGNADGITAGGMNTWKVEVDRTTGTMRVNVNARTNIVTATDTGFIAQYYFGLFAQTTTGNGTAVGRFDYFYIYEQ